MDAKWNIDWDKRIIYLSKELCNNDLVNFFLSISEGERMTNEGPYSKWTIIIISDLN